MFGRRRRGRSQAASLARKRARRIPPGMKPTQTQEAKQILPKQNGKNVDVAATPKATSMTATARQMSASKTSAPPTGELKVAKVASKSQDDQARAAFEAAKAQGKAMGGYTERWAKARGKK